MNDTMRWPGVPERRNPLRRRAGDLMPDIVDVDGVRGGRRQHDQQRISDALAVARTVNEQLVLSALAARDANAAAEIDSQRKTVFLSMLSHELRSPLGAIVTGASLLERQVAGLPAAAKTLSIVKRQAAHLVHLVDDLLDASRITHGKIALRRQRVNLHEVLACSIEAAQPLVDAARQNVEYEMAPEPLHLFGDPVRLTQLFSNLLLNASKFSPPGTAISVLVTTHGAHVSVAIRDQGVGIAPEAQQDVFALFAQSAQAQPYVAPVGLGIGLSLARTLAELHGGSVTLQSDGLGHGSTFTVVLPWRPQRVDACAARMV